MKKIPLYIISFLPVFLAAQAQAIDVNTGEADGAYHAHFCPALGTAASDLNTSIACQTSLGSEENLRRVLANPEQLGYAQFDVFALETRSLGTYQKKYRPIRTDLARECLFMVTKDKSLTNYGDIAAKAADLSFVLPPMGSGSAKTFSFLQQLDSSGLGAATKVRHAGSTKDALIDSLLDDNTVSLFVAFPDPANDLFKAVNANNGHFVPVVSRRILQEASGAQKIYFAEETSVKNPKWHQSGASVTTACTPIVLFTGVTDGPEDPARESFITKLETLPRSTLAPKKGLGSQLWTSSKQLSATAVERIIDLSQKAKKNAGPALTKAKELGKSAVEASKPALEKAKEMSKDALTAAKPWYEKAKEKAKDYLSGDESGDTKTPSPDAGPVPKAPAPTTP